MIPKTIHYCWFGGAKLPTDVKACIKSWKKHCPDYEIIRWDESNYDVNKHPFIKAAYETKSWAFVSDYARLDIIYNHGGIYLDTDVELCKSLDVLLENECYFGIEQKELLIATGLGFGSVAGHSAVKRMLDIYDTLTFDINNKPALSCPFLNTQALAACGFVAEDKFQSVDGASIYPPRFFDPLASGTSTDLTCPETVSIHHYSASWTSGRQRLKRKFVRLIGAKRITKLKRVLR